MNIGLDQPHIRCTVFENFDGALSKRITLGGDGRFVKTGTTQLKLGSYTSCLIPFNGDPTVALAAFGAIIERLGARQAVATGHFRDGRAPNGTVVTEKNLAATNSSAGIFPGITVAAVTRSRANFVAEDGCGLLLIDGDGITDLRPRLIELWLGFSNIAMLVRPSASAGVYDVASGEQMQSGGEHLFIVVSDMRRSREVLYGIDRLAWMKGYGRIELARNGGFLERSIVDTTVWSPSRLIYEGAVTLGTGLAQHPRKVVLFSGGILHV